jgi:4-methyl-5(b-hydroxyethyl)-thiazole monophosphate biosynthesis
MSKILVPLANGLEEIEAVTIIDVCRRAGIEVVTVGVEGIEVEGANGITIKANLLLKDVEGVEGFNMIVLPGGDKGARALKANEKIQTLLKQFKEEDKHIGAICAAPMALESAGVLNHHYTCYPSYENEIRLDGFDDSQKVIQDGKVLTSRGPATTICFALSIVKVLEGNNTFQQLSQGLLADYC